MSLETPPPSAFHSSPCPLVLDPQREMMATSPERHDLSVGIFGGRASDAPRSPQRPPRSPQRQTDNSEVEFLRREVLDLERVIKTLHASRTSEGRERAQQEREFAAAMVELEALRAEHADARTLALELRGDYMFPTRGWVRQGAQTSVASRCDRLFHSSPGLSDLSSACASDLDIESLVLFHVSTYPRIHVPPNPQPVVAQGRCFGSLLRHRCSHKNFHRSTVLQYKIVYDRVEPGACLRRSRQIWLPS